MIVAAAMLLPRAGIAARLGRMSIRFVVVVVGVVAIVGCTAKDKVPPGCVGHAVPDGCTLLQQSGDEDACSGIADCDDGSLRRIEAFDCLDADVRVCPEAGGCADCAAPGVCAEGSLSSCFCYTPCVVDDDCGPSQACICAAGAEDASPTTGNVYPQCVPATCRTDEDCADDASCTLSIDVCGGPARLDCATAEDRCGGDACDGGSDCAFDDDVDAFTCRIRAECD